MQVNAGAEFPVNNTTDGYQSTYPSEGVFDNTSTELARSTRSIAMAADGTFVVVWSSTGQDDATSFLETGVYGRRYNADGTPIGNEFLVNTITKGDQTAPSVAIDALGGFIVTWSSNAGSFQDDNSGFGVYAQRYTSNGEKSGSQFRVNSEPFNQQLSSVVASDRDDDASDANDGGFVITWTSVGQDGDGLGVFARRYNRDGVAQGSDIAVTSVNPANLQTTGSQLNSTVAMADDGSFVVVWESSQRNNSDTSNTTGYNIFAQRFNAQGIAQGDRIQVNSLAAGDQRKPSVAMAADGSFVVGWSSLDPQSFSGLDVYYRRFDRNGTALTATEQQANTNLLGSQQDVMVAMAADGKFILSWSSASGDQGAGIYARRFDANGNPLISSPVNSTSSEFRLDAGAPAGSYSSIAASNNNFAAVWTRNDGSEDGVFGRAYSIITPTDNTPPTNITLTPAPPQVAENSIGAVIGTLSATDPEGNSISYTVSGDDRFEVFGTQLRLKAGQSLNFENDNDKEIVLTVTARDDGNPNLEATQEFTIRTTDVNEAPTNITLSNDKLNENTPGGTVVGTLSATDPDTNQNQTIRFSIAENEFYALSGNQIVVKNGANLNFENPLSRSFKISVTATDNGTPEQSTTQELTITLNDVNEVPVDLQLEGSRTVAENAPGAVIGTVKVTDPDGTTPVLTVSDDRFEIDPSTKNLKLKAGRSLDYEALGTQKEITFDIIATDSQDPSLESRQAVTITVTNVNEAPINLSLSNNKVVENKPGEIVGQLSANDPEGDPQNFSLVGDSPFEIDPLTNNLKLKPGVKLDREATPTISVIVRASDQNNGSLYSDQTLTIDVLNENEPPTDIQLENAQPIDEEVKGAVVGTVKATDPDNPTLTLSVNDPRFQIVQVGADWQLKLSDNASLNYEELVGGKLSLTITATDSDGKTLNRVFEINVNNVNEAPSLSITEQRSVGNKKAGETVGTVISIDPEGTIPSFGVSDARFEVVQIDGVWKLKLKNTESLDYQIEQQVTVEVIATDQSPEKLETRRLVTVRVAEPGAPTNITLTPTNPHQVNEATPNAVVGTVTVDDEDSQTHTFTLDDDRFVIVEVEGKYQLQLAEGKLLDFETATGPIPLKITATDSTNRSVTSEFSIFIQNINEAPTDITITPDSLSVDEQQFGAEIGTIAVIDPDEGDTFSYKFSSDDFSSDDRFEVRNGKLKLKDTAQLDINDRQTINLTITATDPGQLEITKTFQITVDPVNFAPTDITLATNTINEDEDGAIVGKISVVDPDRGDLHTFEFPNDARFMVDGEGNLRLKPNVKVDFETQQTVTLDITAKDNANPQGSFTKQITINVNNLNDAPVLKDFTPAASIAENNEGIAIGTLTVSDPENNPFTLELSDNRFQIDPVAGDVWQIRLKPGEKFDFETLTNGAVSLVVTARDNGTPERTTTLDVAFQVTDVNEAPTNLGLSNLTISEQVAGAEVGLVQVTDPDKNEQFRYEVSDDRFFVENSGKLKLKDGVSLDADTTEEITLTVTAIDRGDERISRQFIIQVERLNLAPTEIELDNTTIDEETLGAIVGKLKVTDPDRFDTHTFTISDARFVVDAEGNLKLTPDASIDYETEKKLTLQITATDNGNPAQSFTKSFEIEVNNLNDAPVLSFTPAQAIAENVSGVTIGTINLSDADLQDTVTLTVTVNGVLDDRFVVEGDQLKLKPGVSFDYETLTDGKLTVALIATDNGNPSKKTELPITIDVANVNEAPTVVTLGSAQIDEGIPDNSLVGSLDTLDPDLNEAFTYQLVDGFGDHAAFVIENNQLRIRKSPDFETKSSYQIQIISTDRDGLSSAPQTFTITVRDLNEPPTNITLQGNIVAENAAGATIGDVAVTDPDSDQFTYEVSDDRFEVKDGKLKLKQGQSLNYEELTDGKLDLSITAIDNGQPVGKLTKPFTITVTNVNEAPSAINLENKSVAENSAGAIVGKLTATDPDKDDTLTLKLSGDDRFEIDNQGNLKLKNGLSLNSEDSAPIQVTVTATDSKGLTRSETFTLEVANVNEAPTGIQLSPSTMEENRAGATIGRLTATDVDSTAFTFTVSDSVRFEVDSQGNLKLKAGQSLNYEELTDGKLSLNITATDNGNPAESFTQQITLNVTNINEAPTEIRLLNDRVEENRAGAIVGQFQVVDPDKNDQFSYQVNDDRFEIDNQGNLKLKNGIGLDREATPTIALNITATDLGGLKKTQQLIITVTDQNEVPTSLTLEGTTVDENASPNTPIGTFKAVDAEGGSFRYSLVPNVADNNAFTIAGDRLLVKNPLDYETQKTYSIQVAVTDSEGLSLIRTFQIEVNNVNEAPIITPDTGTLAYQEDAGAVVIDSTLSLTDVDSQTLSSASVKIVNYVPQQDQLSFTNQNGISGQFDAATGTLTLQGTAAVSTYQNALRSIAYTNTSNAPNTTNRIVQFTARDGALTSQIATRTIQIAPRNDAPIVTPSVSSVVFSVDDRAINLDAAIGIADIDSSTLNGATIALEGYMPGEDNLLFNDQNGIIGSFNAAIGVLTLAGTAALDTYQQVLRSIIYLNSSQQPTAQGRSALITVSDGTSSNPARINLQFQQSVAPPVVDLNGGGAGNDFSNTFVILGQPVAVASNETQLTDSDSTVLTRAEIRISNLFDPNSEMLSVDVAGTGLSASYDRPRGTLNLSGSAPLSSYVKAIQRIRYHNSSPAPDMTTRVILFRVSDGTRLSNAAQTTIQMTSIRLNDGTVIGDPALVTTPATDRINAQDGNDTVISTLANLQQNDLIDGGTGIDTLTLTDGTGNARIEIANSTNQVSGVLVNNTIITNFEQFNWSGFNGSVTLIGSNANDGVITGSGADSLSGGNGNDRLIANGGNDRLDGGAGEDYLEGGTGDDVYVIDSSGDQAIELENGGFDTVSAAISYTLPKDIEDLILTGGALTGTGNALDNGLVGNRLNNFLSAGLGDDLLLGNDGNDTLVGESGEDELTGGLGNDRLLGGDNNDRLDGGVGRDRLTGGKGKDRFILTSSQKSNRDVITDFNSKDDTILISRRSFGRQVRRGRVRISQFVLGSQAQDGNDRFIYNKNSLFFDVDGSGEANQVLIAKLGGRPVIQRSNLRVI
ncbi:cadherin domain-containing protein [Leptolyngbya sp. GB1-A1]|uniref:cadherin domain-containing protein n=1 Tax=Leptolyngbya sp. GB1-A1 TaxID=2933908 RepID=UPI00329A7EB3